MRTPVRGTAEPAGKALAGRSRRSAEAEVDEVAGAEVGMPMAATSALLSRVSSGPSAARLLRRFQGAYGNVATRGLIQVQRTVIQRWVTHAGKFYMGLKPNKVVNGSDKGWLDEMTTWTDYVDAKRNTVYGPAGHKTYAEMMAAVKVAAPVVVKVVPTLPLIPVPINDYRTEFLVDAAELYYSQDSIAEQFSDNTGSIRDLPAKLKAGTVKASAIEAIRLVVMDRAGGKIAVTVDNRRLWAFKKAGLQIKARWASPGERKGSDFKFTAHNGAAKNITVRKQ